MALRIGLGILTGQVPTDSVRSTREEYRAILELAQRAEQCGFDSIWLSEHHFADDGYLPSLLVVLAAIAARTTQIRLGTATLLTPFHHPLRLAEDAAVLNELSAGRLTLGLSNGWRAPEFDAFGIPLSERRARVVETIEVLRRAWTLGSFSHHGEVYRFDNVSVTPRPTNAIPVLLGGNAQVVLWRAGELADGFVADKSNPHRLAEQIEAVEAAAKAAGRHGQPQFVNILDAWMGIPDPDMASSYKYKTEVYRQWHEGRTGTPQIRDCTTTYDRATMPHLICGNVDDLIAQLAPYRDLAITRDLTLTVRFHYPGMPLSRSLEAMTRFATTVLPSLR